MSSKYPNPAHNKRGRVVRYHLFKVVDSHMQENRLKLTMTSVIDSKSLCGDQPVAMLMTQSGKRPIVLFNDEFYEVLKRKIPWKPMGEMWTDGRKKFIVNKIIMEEQQARDLLKRSNMNGILWLPA